MRFNLYESGVCIRSNHTYSESESKDAYKSIEQKKGRLRVGLSHSLAPLKQQVMIGVRSNTHLSARIHVETPAILLPLHNLFTDILVVLNLHAFVFFQSNKTFRSILVISSLHNSLRIEKIGMFELGAQPDLSLAHAMLK